MNEKEEVIAKMRAFARSGVQPTTEALERWANLLEQSEQQTPPVATGEPSSGESSVQPAAISAMESCFNLCEAISKSSVSTNDLSEICDLAIQEGHEVMQIALTMMLMAVEKSYQRQKDAALSTKRNS